MKLPWARLALIVGAGLAAGVLLLGCATPGAVVAPQDISAGSDVVHPGVDLPRRW